MINPMLAMPLSSAIGFLKNPDSELIIDSVVTFIHDYVSEEVYFVMNTEEFIVRVEFVFPEIQALKEMWDRSEGLQM